MPASRIRDVLRAGQIGLLTVLVFLGPTGQPPAALAQSSDFTGPYVGLELGRQHVIGGSLVNGTDTLQEDSRLVASAVGGLRGAIRRLVVGAELGLGRLNGDLSLRDTAQDLDVTYANSGQWHWALTAGPAIAPGTLLYAYVSEVTRQFDVRITQGRAVVVQQDDQGLLRFGLGLERRVARGAHVRVAAGTSRADFGGRRTNIVPGRRLELSLAALWQF